MRILHIEGGRHLYGGAGQVVYLLQGLHDLGLDNLLLCPQGSSVAQAAAPFAQIQEAAWRFDADPAAAIALFRTIRRGRPDVIHAHSRRGADWFAALAAASTKRSAVLTRRVDNPESGAAVRWKYRRFRRVIAISNAVANVLQTSAHVPPTQIQRIPDAVDTDRFRPAPDRAARRATLAAQLHVPPDQPLAAVVAQFIRRKGHAVLLEALPAVFARHPTLTMLWYGQGPGEDGLRRAVQERGWQQRVRFLGFQDNLHQVLPALDFVVHPALAEGMGVALLEAAACGLPVVASAAGGIPEVVEHGQTGLLVPPGDIAALSRALLALLNDPALRQDLGRAARVRVEGEFSIAAMTHAYLRLYQNL